MAILGIEHVQLAMPVGGEDEARQFYSRLLGIPEVTKPPHLAKRGSVWFETGTVNIHLGVDVLEDPLDGYYRVYVTDPFGNRIELMEPLVASPGDGE